jgi:hypothetical protein
MCWAESLNFYLVEQNKKEKDGRQVYPDAKKYFRGEAVKDAILNETVANLETSNWPETLSMVLKVTTTSSMTIRISESS